MEKIYSPRENFEVSKVKKKANYHAVHLKDANKKLLSNINSIIEMEKNSKQLKIYIDEKINFAS
jgi:Zn-finger protein